MTHSAVFVLGLPGRSEPANRNLQQQDCVFLLSSWSRLANVTVRAVLLTSDIIFYFFTDTLSRAQIISLYCQIGDVNCLMGSEGCSRKQSSHGLRYLPGGAHFYNQDGIDNVIHQLNAPVYKTLKYYKNV